MSRFQKRHNTLSSTRSVPVRLKQHAVISNNTLQELKKKRKRIRSATGMSKQHAAKIIKLYQELHM